jgi:hypothetical protein
VSSPGKALVGAINNAPLAVQPGVAAFLVVVVFWALIAHRRLWAGVVRVFALATDYAIGAMLLPEYLMTSVRRRRGWRIGVAALVLRDPVERLLDLASARYERHAATPGAAWRWLIAAAAVLFVASAVLYYVYKDAPEGPPQQFAAKMWSHWLSIRDWLLDH